MCCWRGVKGNLFETPIKCIFLISFICLLIIGFHKQLDSPLDHTDSVMYLHWNFTRKNNNNSLLKNTCENRYSTEICDKKECKVLTGKPMNSQYCDMVSGHAVSKFYQFISLECITAMYHCIYVFIFY